MTKKSRTSLSNRGFPILSLFVNMVSRAGEKPIAFTHFPTASGGSMPYTHHSHEVVDWWWPGRCATAVTSPSLYDLPSSSGFNLMGTQKVAIGQDPEAHQQSMLDAPPSNIGLLCAWSSLASCQHVLSVRKIRHPDHIPTVPLPHPPQSGIFPARSTYFMESLNSLISV